MIHRATESLDLTDQQRSDLERIGKEYTEKLEKTEPPQERGDLIRKMWEAVNGVLTESQREKMKQQMQQRFRQDRRGPDSNGRRRGDESGPPGEPPPPPDSGPPPDSEPDRPDSGEPPPPDRPAQHIPLPGRPQRVWA